jgi:hypothetical protein
MADNRDQIEMIINEKDQLERALASVSDILQNTVQEKDQLSKLFNDFKEHFNTIKVQCGGYQNRLIEEMTARKTQEQESEMRLSHLKQIIEAKQKEIDYIN